MKRSFPNVSVIDGQLYARVKYIDPRTRRPKVKTKRVKSQTEGYQVAQQMRQELKKTTPAEFDGDAMTFSELLSKYPKPLPKWEAGIFETWFGHWKLKAIDYPALEAFRAERASVPHRYTKQPRTERAINKEMETLRRLLRYAHRRGYIQSNPFNEGDALIFKARENARDRIPTDEEIGRLLAHATAPRAHLKPLIIAALDTGLRKGKLLTLTKAQINLQDSVIDLGRPKLKTKKHPRFVGITARLRREFEDWLSAHPDLKDDEPIFGITDDCKRAWKTLCRLAGVTGLNFHDLRHWFATNAILAGLPRDLVMKQTGHTEIKTFDRYFNVNADIARQVSEALNVAHEQKQGSNEMVGVTN